MTRLFLAALSPAVVSSCSNLIVSPGAAVDDGAMISYSADSHVLVGDVSHWPAGKHSPGDLREIYDWDGGMRWGAIPEAAETYTVVGNTNEHQLTIAETTYGGLEVLTSNHICNKKYGCIDYGSLIYVTLQRARTAREAIAIMDDLVQTYGYPSEGESFSIGDPKEAWVMDLIGKGNYSMGAVWVAARVPDGYVGAHANQARIRTFPRDKPDEYLFSRDVVEFAKRIGVYSGSDEDFSFSDAFDPMTFAGARICEARVYSFFVSVAAPEEQMEKYLDYVQGRNLTNRMPLFVKAKAKLNVNDTMWHMRNHYEGLWMDPRHDVGATAWGLPNRFATLFYDYGGNKYVNERPIGVQYAGWNFVSVMRPHHRYGVFWFGPDDSTFSVHAPFYGVTTRIPPAWDGANCTGRSACREANKLPGTRTKFNYRSQHWIQNMIANHAYSRYSEITPQIQSRLIELEKKLFQEVAEMDKTLDAIANDDEAAEAATAFSYSTAENVHGLTHELYGEVFVHTVDGFRMTIDKTDPGAGCKTEYPLWTEAWKARIVKETGDHYKIPSTEDQKPRLFPATPKERLLSLGGPGHARGTPVKKTESPVEVAIV